MKTAAVSELKAHLSEYLNEVKVGGEVLVTDRGKPVARLVPVARVSDANDPLLKLEKQGLIKRGSGTVPEDFWTAERQQDVDGLVLSALLEERETGR